MRSLALRPGSGRPAASGPAAWLALAAAPSFAAMALASALSGNDLAEVLCLTAHGNSVLTAMPTMYVLMSLFHAGPWLKLLGRRQSRAAHLQSR